MFIEDFVECTFGQECNITFLVPPVDGGVGRTVLELANFSKAASALVVLGDTHFQFSDLDVLDKGHVVVLVDVVEDSYRWCTVKISDAGVVSEFHDKEAGVPGPLDALIGAYFFPDLKQLQVEATEAVRVATHEQRRTELADILRRLQRRRPISAVRAGAWLDCGNPDHQASSHRSLLQSREFNELSIDPVMGTVTKRSGLRDKFIDEINYLRLLPADLAVLFPRILDHSTEWDAPWVTLEYYGYPTLAEVFVFENVDPGIWEQIFLHLHAIIVRGFMKRRRPLAPGVLHQMYLRKTMERLTSMAGPTELLKLVQHDGRVTVNGREVTNIAVLWDRLTGEVDELSRNLTGSIVHGDLCLSNILYDLRSRICKFLDPRGSFGTAGIYGDPRYDVAKLYHSVYGLYDFICNDLFHVAVDGTNVSLDIRSRPQHCEIQRRFEKVFFADFDRREILLIAGLLFASMPALHYEAPRRQIAMYARSLTLLDEAFALPARSKD
jgi:dTDP-glucose pyrophosphorylase